MTREEMLAALNDEGDNAGADYNDGLDGWFGWDVRTVTHSASGAFIRHELDITFTDANEHTLTRTWTLEAHRD